MTPLRAPVGKVLVRLFPAEEKTASGTLFIPERAKNKRPRRGVVVAVGPERKGEPLLLMSHTPELSDERREEIMRQIKSQGRGGVISCPQQGEDLEITFQTLPRIVEVGDEVICSQWNVSTALEGHVGEATFNFEGEKLTILDEYKDIYAVVERDGPEDQGVVE